MHDTYSTHQAEQITRPDDLGIIRASLSSAIKMLIVLACHLYLTLPGIMHACQIGLQNVPVKIHLILTALNVVVAFVVAVTVYGARISDGKIKTLLRAMEYEEVMTFEILEHRGKHQDETLLVFRSFTGREITLSHKRCSKVDWERTKSWAERFFMPGTQWLTHNFELFYKRHPEALPE